MALKSIDPDILYPVYYNPLSVGRKTSKPDTQIRQLFFSVRRQNHMIQPKKEYIRCRLIRGHKRANRQISRRILPTKTLNRFDPQNTRAVFCWDEMKRILKKDPAILSRALTENGPKTDGKSKRHSAPKDLQNSFNLHFCQNYFSPLSIRESYYYYIELVFAEFDPEQLSQKLELRCCAGIHSSDCAVKWCVLKKYVQQGLLLDLNLEPFAPPGDRAFPVPAFPDFLSEESCVG